MNAENYPLANLKAQKALGQHFLFDPNILTRIARAAGSLEGQHVLEVGPGPGGLTRTLLAEQPASVTTIETDSRFTENLESWNAPDLEVIKQDATRVDYGELFGDKAPITVIANLPYNVATPLILGWLKQPHIFGKMALMIQLEVAERICAKPKTNAYGRLSIICQSLAKTSIAFQVPPGAFRPPPKVMSAVVLLEPLPEQERFQKIHLLEEITAAAFGQRRKMLRASLKSFAASHKLKAEDWINENDIDPTLRAEALSISDFQKLAVSLSG